MKGSRFKLIQDLATQQQITEATAKFAGLPNACVRATIKDVDDPKERGRVRVVFDDFDPRIPQVAFAGDASKARIAEGEPQLSHWIDVSPAFKGKQPKGMIDKHCNITISNGQYQYAVLGDVLYDPEVFTEEAGEELEQPNNSSMTRMPIYDAGELPPPCEENHGCSVIEKGGPYGDDWLCICLKRGGRYLWVRHIDMQHAHAGANDTTAYPDSGGDKPFPGKAVTGWDFTFPTSGAEMVKYSAYGTNPTPGPYGDEVQWFPSPMSDDEPLEAVPPSVNNQDEAEAFLREENGFTEDIPGDVVPIPDISIPGLDSILPFLGFNIDFNKMLNSLLDYAKKQALEELSKATGGISDTVIQTTGVQI